jgi:hypothetical protein
MLLVRIQSEMSEIREVFRADVSENINKKMKRIGLFRPSVSQSLSVQKCKIDGV